MKFNQKYLRKPAALEFELVIVLEACLLFCSQDLVAEHEPLVIISLQVAVDDAIDGHLIHLHLYCKGVIIIEFINIETNFILTPTL